jgi:putative tricarboxylic transport membrane protein
LSCTGIYAVNHSTLDLWLAALFGIAGYVLKTFGFKPTPLLLGFVLSRPLEENLARALVFADGDMTTFIREPISAALLAVAAASILLSAAPAIRRWDLLKGELR